jgi:hypothetical protein
MAAAGLLRCAVGPLALAAAVLLAACGDDGDDRAAAVDPRSALSCVEEKGLLASLSFEPG